MSCVARHPHENLAPHSYKACSRQESGSQGLSSKMSLGSTQAKGNFIHQLLQRAQTCPRPETRVHLRREQSRALDLNNTRELLALPKRTSCIMSTTSSASCSVTNSLSSTLARAFTQRKVTRQRGRQPGFSPHKLVALSSTTRDGSLSCQRGTQAFPCRAIDYSHENR